MVEEARGSAGEPTLADVARRAGVSVATASRALSVRGPASASARHRVAEAARDLGYAPNPVARALATRSGTRIAVAVGGHTAHVLNDPYAARVTAATATTAAAHGVGASLHWLPLHDPAELGRLAENRDIGGIIVVNPTPAALAAVPRRARARIASIGIGTRDIPSFDVDNATGTRRVVEHLLATGRRRIAMITGPSWLPCTDRALTAYRRALADAGAPPRLVAGDFTAATGESAAAEITTRWPDTDAIFALGDLSALGALTALRRTGVDVPGDVAVAGFDDIAYATLSRPGLTTTTNPVEAITTGAATAVLDRRPGPPQTFYPSTLVLRAST
ncbi:LacI family DNA-binding transcriptional regulator [Saccharothrix sp. 6-C]|uniref:LacI family DNA-binding transcriptional regulator n=1 Tax=Saccharothrix sp. 6-C TaxID=2781735 RepID=UPI00191730F3|nr:LacI family DNA-binding transcriptional regulator [Saccharothrix sp. 6-C]QQQ74315.1 LacI family DNA-binding transcriptional regulator [Saccharothrix sp. 6-C]